MLRRVVLPIILCWLAIALPGTLSAAAPAQPPSSPPRIVAIGDLHGDHDAWMAIARGAGIVDATGHWAGGNSILVQLGDVVDRGGDSRAILRDLIRLEKEASHRGGRVVALIGNHEAMNMTGDLRYVDPGEYAAFVDKGSERRRREYYEANRQTIEAAAKARNASESPAAIRDAWLKQVPLGAIEHAAAWRPSGEIGRWILSHNAVARIGGSLFVHGGISATYATQTIDQINQQVTAALKAQEQSPTSIINDEQGPLWYRGLVTRAPSGDAPSGAASPAAASPAVARPTIDQEVDLVLRAYDVKRIVVAHTPSLKGIIGGVGGRLWRIDSGNARYYGGPPSYLEIVGDRVTARQVPRPPPSTKGENR